MRKVILIPFVVIFIFTAFVALHSKNNHLNQIRQGVSFTEEEQNQYHCSQSILWFPDGLIGGILLLSYFQDKTKRHTKILYCGFGIVIILLTLLDTLNNCSLYKVLQLPFH